MMIQNLRFKLGSVLLALIVIFRASVAEFVEENQVIQI